nr:class I SAM-dependent methyltransferase [Maliibacterium massiliense]
MCDHYYSSQPTSAHARQSLTLEDAAGTLRFTSDAGVFSRDHVDAGTRLLLSALPDVSGEALDLGCGYGVIGIAMAKRCPKSRWLLADVNARALSLARENLAANGVRNALVIASDGFAAIEGTFALIVTNPPIRIGKQALQAMWRDARAHLLPEGALYLVIRKQQGAPSAKAFLQGLFGNCETVARGGGYWVLRCVKQA